MVLTQSEKEKIAMATALRCIEKCIPKQFWIHLGIENSKADLIWQEAEEVYEQRTESVNLY